MVYASTLLIVATLVAVIYGYRTQLFAFYNGHRGISNVGFALAIALSIAHLQGVFSAAQAASFSIDLTGVLDVASQLFNGLFPIFGIILGITIGIGIITMVVNRVSQVFGRG